MLTVVLIILIVLILLANLFFFWKLAKKTEKPAAQDDSRSLNLILQQINEQSRSFDQRVSDIQKTVDSKLGESGKLMGDSMKAQFSESQRLATDIRDLVSRQLLEVAKNVSETKESTKQVFTIAEQLQNLEKVLKHQKQRGNLGEASLELVLSNILPPTAYKIQYQFPDNKVVDAVIITKEGIIPIDAKFSLDNYSRLMNETDEVRKAALEKQFKDDLKARIDETAKYVRPKDGTLPFAFMYIPAEGIYYDLLINEVGAAKVSARNLIDYAYNDRKVIIVSPTTFAAYLQSVLFGLKAFKYEEGAKDIAKNVENLLRHIKAYDDYYKRLGNALMTTVNHYDAGSREIGKIVKDANKITDKSIEIEPLIVNKPLLENRE